MSPEADPASHSAASSAIAPLPIPPEATEEQLIALWLHGKSPNTIRAYRRDIAAFRATIVKPIRLAYLGDLQRYAGSVGIRPDPDGCGQGRGAEEEALTPLAAPCQRVARAPAQGPAVTIRDSLGHASPDLYLSSSTCDVMHRGRTATPGPGGSRRSRLPSPTAHEVVRSVHRGLRRRSESRSAQGRAHRRRLRQTIGAIDLASRIGLRDRALLLLSLAGAFRRGELGEEWGMEGSEGMCAVSFHVRRVACLAAFAAASTLAACQGITGTGASGLPQAPGQGVAPGQGGSGPAPQSRTRVVEGAVYLTPEMGEIPLPSLGQFGVTLLLASPSPATSSAAGPTASPAVRPSGSALSSRSRSAKAGAVSPDPAAGPDASPSAVPSSSASPVPSDAASPSASGSPGAQPLPSSVPGPQPSGPKIDTKLTIYAEDTPTAPTPAPTGSVQTYLKRVPILRGDVYPHADLTLYGLGAVRFTIPAEEQTKDRGFTVAIFEGSKKHRERLLASDPGAVLATDVVSAVVTPSPIPLKKDTRYSLLLYGDELVPSPAPNAGAYPAPGNNPFVTPLPGAGYGSAAPYPTQTYNPSATPTPYGPH